MIGTAILALGKNDKLFCAVVLVGTSSTKKRWLAQHKVKITSMALNSTVKAGFQ